MSVNIYLKYREIYLKHLSKYSSWEEYLQNWLNQSDEFRFDNTYFVEKLIEDLRERMEIVFFSKYPFFKQFNPKFEEYKDFLNSLKYHDEFFIISKLGARKVKIELFDIRREDLYYPNIKIVYSCHSALHSLAMLVKGITDNRVAKPDLVFYQEPLTTHPGDREYVMYYTNLFKIPLVIGKRQENISWLLEKNGVPKIGKLGRWCSRIFKTEVAELFYLDFFYPLQYKLTKPQYQEYVRKQREARLFGKELPKSTHYHQLDTPFQISNWDNEKKEWIGSSIFTNSFPIYEKKYKHVPEKKDPSKMREVFDTYGKKIGEYLTPYNIVQMVGINKFQSRNRALANPNIILWEGAKPDSNFLIYQHYPLFHESYFDMLYLIRNSGKKIKTNPYDVEYNMLFQPGTDVPQHENRFGCVYCPYKAGDYYILLKEKFPEAYYFCNFLRLVGSARTILKGEKEYYWWDERHTPKTHPEWSKIMNIM
jgi:hypothetical protein